MRAGTHSTHKQDKDIVQCENNVQIFIASLGSGGIPVRDNSSELAIMYLGHSNFLNVQGHVQVCSGIRLGNTQGTLMSRVPCISVIRQQNTDTIREGGVLCKGGKKRRNNATANNSTSLQSCMVKRSIPENLPATKPHKSKWMRRIKFLKCSLSNKGMARLVVLKKANTATNGHTTCALKFHQD